MTDFLESTSLPAYVPTHSTTSHIMEDMDRQMPYSLISKPLHYQSYKEGEIFVDEWTDKGDGFGRDGAEKSCMKKARMTKETNPNGKDELIFEIDL